MNWRLIAAAALLFLLGYRLNAPASGEGLSVPERSFDFGAIGDSVKVTHIFRIENKGDDSLMITNVHSSCGCTAAVLDKEAIAPDGFANLEVTLDPKGKIGKIEKTVWITSNLGTDSLSVIADVKGVHENAMMRVDGIFAGDCRKCHVDKGVGKFGMELFTASCSMCHTNGGKAHAPHLGEMVHKNLADTTLYRIIAEGKAKTNMPGYAPAHGGPLTDEQIHSLVALLQYKELH